MTALQIRNPYSGLIDYEIGVATSKKVEDTCKRLRRNQKKWEALGVEGRLVVLDEFAAAIERNFRMVHAAVSADTGRAKMSVVETLFIGRTLHRLRNEAAVLKNPEPRPSLNPVVVAQGQYVPFGLVGNIAPWNYPIILSFLDGLPALVAGNALVIKPSTVTPRYADALSKVLEEVPQLAEVLAFLHGPGNTVGREIIDRVDCICLTGSTAVGEKVARDAGARFIPAFLELGGNDPAIVLPSADLKKSVDTILWSAVRAAGQTCSSIERVYVPAAMFDRFIDVMVAKAEEVEINYPDINNGGIGPFIQEAQADVVKNQLDEAEERGARILCGGEIINHGGKWMRPTVVVDVDHSMKLMKEETFGPVVPVMPYETTQQAIDLANDTTYGLSAAVFAGTIEEGAIVAHGINAGCVGINDASVQSTVHDVPHVSFGRSGFGQSRFGPDGLLRFVRRKAICGNTTGEKSLESYNKMLDAMMAPYLSS